MSEFKELIDNPLTDLMARYFAGEWNADPDGGVCSAMLEAYKLGKSEMEELLRRESESHQETADIMRRIREDRDRLREQLSFFMDD